MQSEASEAIGAAAPPRARAPAAAEVPRGVWIGNLAAATVLALGGLALPVRYWPLDVPVALVILLLVGTSASAAFSAAGAVRWVRIACFSLLGVGLALFAMVALSAAFLWGVHGEYGTLGVLVMVLVLALVLPYCLAWPVIALRLLSRRSADERGSAR